MIDWKWVNQNFDGADGLARALSDILCALAQLEDVDLSGVTCDMYDGSESDGNVVYDLLIVEVFKLLTDLVLQIEEQPKPKAVK